LPPHTQPNQHPDVLHGPRESGLIRHEVLADIFEATARQYPEKIALIAGDHQLSYGALNAKADLAAARLMADGVGPGHIVGLCLPRGAALLVMQLAIAKTGAAWLPLDEQTPAERIAVCLADAASPGIVTCPAFADRLAHVAPAVWVDEVLLGSHGDPALPQRPARTAQPEHPAYVIYTSGSTGKPKGIAISQGSICHFLRSENSVLGVRSDDRVYQGFSVAFDMSFEEIWISYLVGATLWLAPKDVSTDPQALSAALVAQGITVLHAVPTLLALLEMDAPHLRLINLGGEMCPQSLVDTWARPGRQIFNTYGPTEATVSASLAELRAGAPVTIGTPLPNYSMLVIAPDVENGLRLLPRGEVGELCIAGPGVAVGYLGRPELTREKFIDNPWSGSSYDPRLYRTGDLARIDAQGQVQCLGRADDQIKIRGFRVELGEIEAVLMQQAGVGTVAVLLRQAQGVEQLMAFVVPTLESSPSIPALRSALAAQLPPYMVPSRFEMLAQMPRLTSGKIDRKALATLPLAASAAELEGSDTPQNEAETVLFAALSRLFPGQPIRRGLDFFTDLGGHSLFAAKLASSLRHDPRFAQVTVGDIYKHRVLGQLAQSLQANAHMTVPQASPWTPASAWQRWRCGLAQVAAADAAHVVVVGAIFYLPLLDW
jgi:amino acid adenylation domain-containing protein